MSDFEKFLLSAAAVALAAFGGPLWAAVKRSLASVHLPDVPAPAPVPPVAPAPPTAVLDAATFAGAIECLSIVRTRLAKTDCLDEPSAAAIETLTHGLVKGSDK